MISTRQILVSTDVYAAVWAARRPGEENEDAVLRRLLQVTTTASNKPLSTDQIARSSITKGFVDPRFGIALPEGFEIFRTYLGVEYRAKAVGGSWLLLNDGQAYPSLNQLSRAVGTKVENAWNNWYFIDSQGMRKLITTLRKGQ
ncbi:MAG: hypothetical protein KDE14_16155 [Rhodobacteraceae bacterium]|nr:hypothetical protein [Paracoccaceae bacterium]